MGGFKYLRDLISELRELSKDSQDLGRVSRRCSEQALLVGDNDLCLIVLLLEAGEHLSY